MRHAPTWYKVVAVLALLWNLIGCAAYVAEMMMTPETIAALPEADRALYAARPAWFVAAYAVAVWFGALGSLGLVLRKRWATGALVASLIGLLVQDAGLLRIAGGTQPGVLALQGAVLVIAILLVLLARKATHEQWIV